MIRKSNRQVWVVIAALIVSSSAAGMYCPEAGRFLQQDPMEYVDGMNLYEYVGGKPIILLDPSGLLWHINRAGNSKATATVIMSPDTVRILSNKIGLEAIDYQKWITLEGEITVNGGTKKTLTSLLMSDKICPNQSLHIPNTVFAHWAGEVGDIGKAWVHWDEDVAYLSSLGFAIEEHSGGTNIPFEDYLKFTTKSKDLHGMYFWGHGARKGKNGPWTYLVTDPEAYKLTYADYYLTNYRKDWKPKLNYRLGLGLIYACGGKYAQIGNFSSNGIFWGSTEVMVPIGTPRVSDIIHPGDQGTQSK